MWYKKSVVRTVRGTNSAWHEQCTGPVAETWRRVWGDGHFFRGPRFLNDNFFAKNFHSHGQNFWWPFFSHWSGFSDFPFLFPDFPYLYYVKCRRLQCIYDPFPTRKTTISVKNSFMTPFFTLFVLSRASDNTTSQNIEGTDAWAVPHLKFFWGTVPQSPFRSSPLLGTNSLWEEQSGDKSSGGNARIPYTL